jgi:hypothetical protein
VKLFRAIQMDSRSWFFRMLDQVRNDGELWSIKLLRGIVQIRLLRRKNGGERGIRTLGTAFGSTHDFQSCSFNQLGHLSIIDQLIKSSCLKTLPLKYLLAERVGFEPTIPLFTGYRFSRAGPSAARPPLRLSPFGIQAILFI